MNPNDFYLNAVKRMKEIEKLSHTPKGDVEALHIEADEIFLMQLELYDCHKLTDPFRKMYKYYS